MFEREVEVRSYVVKAWCTECNGGEMRSTGRAKTSMPPKYTHKCEECGHTEDLDAVYPIARYREMKEGK